MFERRSIRWPVTLGVTMIVLLVALTVGWVMLSVYGAQADRVFAPLYWTLLTVGATFLLLVLVGVVLYLTLSVKAINLTQRQSNFIDSVTHELKSPIASLKLYLQTLNRRHVSAEEQANFFRFMLEDVERLDGLINHLLDAARLERKPGDGEDEDVELLALLADCAEAVSLRYRVPPERISLSGPACVVHARRVDLDMIFRNLVDNAVKYAGEQPQVEITTSIKAPNHVEVRIADNGRGIPANLRRKIFGRFVRLGSELEREKPGTGLGLYIVRTLIQRLRGKVRVRGREPAAGTIFEVNLPGRIETADEVADNRLQGTEDSEAKPLDSN